MRVVVALQSFAHLSQQARLISPFPVIHPRCSIGQNGLKPAIRCTLHGCLQRGRSVIPPRTHQDLLWEKRDVLSIGTTNR